jgi:hypothetical protein
MKLAAAAGLVGLLMLSGCGRPQSDASSDTDTSDVGRFVIVHSPQVEGDTVLLDTATGQSWQRVEVGDLQHNPTVWVPMPQMNSDKDWAVLRAKYPPNPPEAPAAEAPAAGPSAEPPRTSAPQP